MNKYTLPKSITINEKEILFKSDFRDILYLFEILNDPNLLDEEKIILCAENFYLSEDYLYDINFAIDEMWTFISGGNKSETNHTATKPLYDWEQDFEIIVAPVNRVLNTDIRGLDYLHWWTFLSAFMEIGECTFNTYVGIRDKLNKGKKLEKWEERVYKEHADSIKLKRKVDDTTQALMDEILGREA